MFVSLTAYVDIRSRVRLFRRLWIYLNNYSHYSLSDQSITMDRATLLKLALWLERGIIIGLQVA